MPTWVKVTLVAVVIGFAVLVVGIVFAARWVKSAGTDLAKQADAAFTEGASFGEGKDSRACMVEGLRRAQACKSLLCETTVNVFVQNCLQVATVTPESCAGVAKPGDLMDSAKWQQAECARLGARGDVRCIRMVGALQVRCADVK